MLPKSRLSEANRPADHRLAEGDPPTPMYQPISFIIRLISGDMFKLRFTRAQLGQTLGALSLHQSYERFAHELTAFSNSTDLFSPLKQFII